MHQYDTPMYIQEPMYAWVRNGTSISLGHPQMLWRFSFFKHSAAHPIMRDGAKMVNHYVPYGFVWRGVPLNFDDLNITFPIKIAIWGYTPIFNHSSSSAPSILFFPGGSTWKSMLKGNAMYTWVCLKLLQQGTSKTPVARHFLMNITNLGVFQQD